MKIFIVTLGLLMSLSSYVMAEDEKTYPAVCLTPTQVSALVKQVEQKNGYQLVEFQNTEYVMIADSCMEVPKNNCAEGTIPLFVQP